MPPPMASGIPPGAAAPVIGPGVVGPMRDESSPPHASTITATPDMKKRTMRRDIETLLCGQWSRTQPEYRRDSAGTCRESRSRQREGREFSGGVAKFQPAGAGL